MASVAKLQTMTSEALSKMILAEQDLPAQTYAIVDVRDEDYLGGHIKGSLHFPSPELDDRMPDLIDGLKDKQIAVFHCMFSQQRGPSAALKYLRQRGGNPEDGPVVYVLEGGFDAWKERAFVEDQRLTEMYRKELWNMA